MIDAVVVVSRPLLCLWLLLWLLWLSHIIHPLIQSTVFLTLSTLFLSQLTLYLTQSTLFLTQPTHSTVLQKNTGVATSLKELNVIYTENCAMSRKMEEEVKVVDGEYAATISNLVKLEKKQKRLERLWDDGILSGEEVGAFIMTSPIV